MVEFSIIPISEITSASRWDSEAFSPFIIQTLSAFRDQPQLGQLCSITHASEIPRMYSENECGRPFLLAQNIRFILPDYSSLRYIPEATWRSIPINRLEYGDTLVTRSGANVGDACVFLDESGSAYTSGEGLIIRSKGNIEGAYLAVYLNTETGARLCRRAIYGGGQPHIGPRYLKEVPVFRDPILEKSVTAIVKEAYSIIEKSKKQYPEAEQELLERLGWGELQKQKSELFFVESTTKLDRMGRSDAEHFQPKYQRLRRQLTRHGARLGDFSPLPNRGVQPLFVPDGDVFVLASKAIRPQGVTPVEDARTTMAFWDDAANEKARVSKGDVLLNSTGVGTLGRASFYLEDAPAIADNHVAIIRPDETVCLSPYLSLFLNSPAGIAQSEMFQTGSSGQLEIYPQHIQEILIYLPRNLDGSIDLTWQKKLADKVVGASQAKQQAQEKLAQAKKLVEDAIESATSH